jgi:hypothetical protein
MKISALKQHLSTATSVNFRLPDNSYVPAHFHVTEVGLVNKHFIDCGGTVRKESTASLQLWQAQDYDHRLSAQKLLHILELSNPILGTDDLNIEVEYQQNTIGKFGLEFDGNDFVLVATQTACLASDACGIPEKKKLTLSELTTQQACCTPGGGCC